jgi:hypothetical protein
MMGEEPAKSENALATCTSAAWSCTRVLQLTPEERHSLKELPAILRSLKHVLATAPLKEIPRYENGKVILSLNEARKLAGGRAETFLRAIENQEIEGAKKNYSWPHWPMASASVGRTEMDRISIVIIIVMTYVAR